MLSSCTSATNGDGDVGMTNTLPTAVAVGAERLIEAGVPEALPGDAVLLALPVAADMTIDAGAPDAAAGEPEPDAVAVGAVSVTPARRPAASAFARYISGVASKN